GWGFLHYRVVICGLLARIGRVDYRMRPARNIAIDLQETIDLPLPIEDSLGRMLHARFAHPVAQLRITGQAKHGLGHPGDETRTTRSIDADPTFVRDVKPGTSPACDDQWQPEGHCFKRGASTALTQAGQDEYVGVPHARRSLGSVHPSCEVHPVANAKPHGLC